MKPTFFATPHPWEAAAHADRRLRRGAHTGAPHAPWPEASVMTRASELAVFVLLALVGASCGRLGLDQPGAGGGMLDPGPDAANIDGARVVDAADDGGGAVAPAPLLRV